MSDTWRSDALALAEQVNETFGIIDAYHAGLLCGSLAPGDDRNFALKVYWVRGPGGEGQGWNSGLIAARYHPVKPSPRFGKLYGGELPSYWVPTVGEGGPVWMWRKGQRVRFHDHKGIQVGPEQANVAPAVAYAMSRGWVRL